MADISQPGSSKSLIPAPVPQQQEDDGIDLNNNDPNNNVEFGEDVQDEDVDDIQVKLLNEARTIHAILGQFALSEVYSYLEMNIDHPERMQFVMNNFLARENEPKRAGSKRLGPGDQGEVSRKEMKLAPSRSPSVIDLDDTSYVLSSDDDVFDYAPADQLRKEPHTDETVPKVDFQMEEVQPDFNRVDPEPQTVVLDDSRQDDDAALPVPPILNVDVDGQILTLKEMFPDMEINTLKERYMSVLPIEGARTLDVLVAQMLDIADDIPMEVLAVQAPPPAVSVETKARPSHETAAAAAASIDEPKAGPSIEPVAGPSHEPVAGPSREPVAGPSQAPVAGTSQEPEDEWEEGDTIVVEPELREQLSYLMCVLPDADPIFLEEKCNEFKDNKTGLETFVADAMENKNYPTLRDHNKREEENKELKKFSGRITVKDFLEVFPDPQIYFNGKVHANDVEYKERSLHYLQSRFRNIAKNSITGTFRRNNYNLTKTVDDLAKGVGVIFLKRTRPVVSEPAYLQDCKHLHFIQEVTYVEKKTEIENYLVELEEQKKAQFEMAKQNGELLECGCCFDSECLITNMSACPEGHLFCKECIQRFAENEIGDGKTKFKCLEGECPVEFSLTVLQEVLSSKMFSRLVQKKQLEEVTAANIEGLETCPFCEFGTIPAPGDRIFRCLNPDCMKDSCRECREPSHIPLRCDEVEKDEEVRARKFIEDRMTEALVRECWKCKKKFVKTDGCNKMTCSCGAKMCYICRQPITDYSHFSERNEPQSNKCPLWVNNDQLHVDAVTKEAQKALQELKEKEPTMNLKYDPTKILPVAQQPAQANPAAPWLEFHHGLQNVIDDMRERINQARVMAIERDDRHRNLFPLVARGAHRFLQRVPPPLHNMVLRPQEAPPALNFNYVPRAANVPPHAQQQRIQPLFCPLQVNHFLKPPNAARNHFVNPNPLPAAQAFRHVAPPIPIQNRVIVPDVPFPPADRMPRFQDIPAVPVGPQNNLQGDLLPHRPILADAQIAAQDRRLERARRRAEDYGRRYRALFQEEDRLHESAARAQLRGNFDKTERKRDQARMIHRQARELRARHRIALEEVDRLQRQQT